jgi:hypothetical protein
VVVAWPSRVGVSSRVESGRVEAFRQESAARATKNRAGQNRTKQENRSKRFGTRGFAVAVKGTVACLGLGVRGSGNEHAAAHAKARTEKEMLGDGESQTESTYVAEQTRPWTWGITINQSIVISERTARTEPLALPRRRRRRRLRLVAQAPLRRFVTRPRLQGVATVACQQRCPRESVHITFLYLLWYNSSRGCAATYINIPPVDQTNRRAASRK